MPNLVGIGNSQVPTNAMLGRLAYQDSVGEIAIDKIKARTSDTAVDIFVYDTRKDSDGGAWRHRTQNTSWYNEGVSELRGARKEFPAVAVLVLEHLKLTIYDGDDPNMPMWMILPTIANQQNMIAGFNDHDLITVAALNGIIVVGSSPSWNHGNIVKVNFIKDDAVAICHNNDKKWIGGIINRNSDAYWQDITSGNYLVTNHVNDVAMTVLPNAPIDASTGLPVPTIAVATEGGTNIINNNGTVTQGYSTITSENIDIHSSGFMLEGITGASNDNFSLFKIGNTTRVTYYDARASFGAYDTFLNEGSGDCLFEGSNNKLAIAQTLGLLRIEEEFSDYATGLHNRTASSYNTGWMVGDIKGAFLSDTDATDITGSELITNGTFDSNVNNWVENTSTNTHSSGRMQITRSGGTGATAYQAFTTEVGKTYVATAEVNSSGSRGDLHVRNGTGWGGTGLLYVAGTASQTKILTGNFTATSTTSTIAFGIDNNNTSIFVDNVSVRIAELDRSVNNKGIQVFGTIKKDPVAPGAELVGYHGVSSTNYLVQPFNADLNFGTGDFSIFVWVKKNTFSTNHYIIDRARTLPSWDATNRTYFIINYQGYHRFRLAGGSQVSGSVRPMKAGVFNHVGFVRRNGTMEFWLNGELVETVTGSDASASFHNGGTDMSTTVNRYGNGFAADYTFDRMALLRISGTAPSSDQVRKMYNDEKCLFHEKAKCTLHGTSDAVTALAFDDTNDVLHVGTSSGRSEFQGLKRINNTTTEVTTAISVSDGFVAEQ